MLNRIIDWAVDNRLLVVLALLGVGAGAATLLPRLNLDAFPDVTNVQVTVNAEAPGLAAEEVEQLITFPIEAVMYSLPDVDEVRSISATGLAVITVVFEEGTDIYFARQLVFERLQEAREQIPEGVGVPEMGPNTSGLGQVFKYYLRAEDPSRYDAMTLRSLNDWVIKLLLMPVEGVTNVLSFGGEVRQYQVRLDPQRLLAQQLSPQDVTAVIQANNRNAGGWYMDRGAEQLVIRGVGWVRSGDPGLSDIANVPLKEEDGVTVRVRDVGDVAFGAEIRQGAVTMTRRGADGRVEQLGEIVSGIVLKRIGANTRATINGVKERLPIIRQALPEGVTLEVFYDQSELVDSAVQTVARALLQAFVLIAVILTLFLMNLRAMFLVLVSIPVSIVMALMCMAYWDVSANLMSLGGLAIAIGMMVDGSVVMVENVIRRLNEVAPGDGPAPGRPGGVPLHIQEAAREVGRPVFFAVMIVIIVFAPLFALQGVEGKMFRPMALSIVFAMVAALAVALVVAPALATYLFRRAPRQRTNPLLLRLTRVYERTLRWSLAHRPAIIAGAATLLLGALSMTPWLGTEFVPELEEGSLNIRVTLAPSSNMDTGLAVAEQLEARLMRFPEVLYAASHLGRPELGGDPEPISNIEILVGLRPVRDWTSARDRYALQVLMEEEMSTVPGVLFSFSQPIATRVDELLSGVRAQLAIKLFGPDLDVLAEKGAEIEALASAVQGARDVAMEQISGEAQLVVRPDRDALARFGIPVDDVMSLVADAIGGRTAGQVIRGNERYDIYVRLDEAQRSSADGIRQLVLQAPNGAWVRLGDVAQVEIESGPPQIRRDDVQRRVVIQSNVVGRDMGGLVTELRQRIAGEVDLPPGYSVVFGGQFENQQRAQARLAIVVPLSLGLIFLLLYFAFQSVGQAFLIMLNVPLALIGGIAALFFSGQYLSVPGSIGFVALLGVAVLNGVVMVNAVNYRIENGMTAEDAVLDGAMSRLRPVLMTATTTALGLIPMLLSRGVGAEIQRPLATVVVGGLVSSTLLTLVILPVLYTVFSRRKYAHVALPVTGRAG
ncbi:MAG: CusA/CzcA family heavy metal efflux RND transporter [Rhodospirillaceae bacterium]|nr:CusA/CzcA family heavy metal efflux RND transporter [Rhodospirillaceae bacterium]